MSATQTQNSTEFKVTRRFYPGSSADKGHQVQASGNSAGGSNGGGKCSGGGSGGGGKSNR